MLISYTFYFNHILFEYKVSPFYKKLNVTILAVKF